MKKLLSLIGLALLAACGGPGATPEATATPAATATSIPPTPIPISSPQGATATPTLAPTPTATDTPPERYFTDEFDTAPKYWSILYASGDQDRVEVLNEYSKLTFELYSQQAWVYAIYGPFDYDRVHIETSVESQGSDINAMGLVCNYDEQAGWYEFNISSDGAYNLLHGQWLAEGVARYTPILDDTTNLIQPGNAVNRIGLDCYQNTVQMSVNGNSLRSISVEYIGLTGGKVGLSLASFEEAPVILSFDWVKVSEP